MFLHNLKYEILSSLRQKEQIFWMMCFPIILSTFFFLAFGNLYEQDEVFSKIPVAVVENKEDTAFRTVMNQLSSGDTPMFSTEYTDEEKALDMLENGKADGIIYVDESLTLSVAGNGLKASIIQSFLKQYEIQKAIITEIVTYNPEKLDNVISALSAEINCIDDDKITTGNMDVYAQYFFNLIAMVALFGTTNGLFAATSNQGNLSAIGARKCVSPTNKLKSIIASLLAAFVSQVLCVILSTSYILFVLKINLGDNILLVYFSGIVGTLAGTALGFFIGSVGRVTENAKFGVAMPFTMICCFLSGLMVGQMKYIVAQFCPVFNKINPAALISDLFYCLSIYDDYRRYTENVVILLIMSVVFTFGGFLFTRRKKYASI